MHGRGPWAQVRAVCAVLAIAQLGSVALTYSGRAAEGGAPGRIRTLDPQFRRLAVLATREPCRPAMSRGGSAASCRSRPSASLSGRRCQRTSRSPLSVASTSKEPQGDLLTASSSRGGERRRRTRSRGLHGAGPRDVFAACGNTRRARVEPILASWNESGTNQERSELSWNAAGTFCEPLIAR